MLRRVENHNDDLHILFDERRHSIYLKPVSDPAFDKTTGGMHSSHIR